MKKKVFITGSNRGIGLSLVIQFLKNDFMIFAGCRDLESSKTLLDLSKDYKDNLVILKIDVSDENSIKVKYLIIIKIGMFRKFKKIYRKIRFYY
jgi:NAD(P)-dependent dehydrogenase (short-subunit alcohol dehydrogenase family)